MAEKKSASIISMSGDKKRAEVVTITKRADGKFHSVTRHIHRKVDGTWAGISSSDEVLRNHAAAGKRYNVAQRNLTEAQNALKNAEKAHQKAVANAAKDPSEKVRAQVNVAVRTLEKAKKVIPDATEAVKQAVATKEALEKSTPLVVGYSI